MRVEHGAVRSPARGVGLDGRALPAALAEDVPLDAAELAVVRGVRQPVLGVRFPIPVRRELGELAEALLARAQRGERARLQRSEPNQALQRPVARSSLGEEIVGAARQRAGAHVRVAVGGERDDRLVAGVHQPGDGGLAGRVGKMQVGDDEIEVLAGEPPERAGQRAFELDGAQHTLDRAQPQLYERGEAALVLDEQDANGLRVAHAIGVVLLLAHGGENTFPIGGFSRKRQ